MITATMLVLFSVPPQMPPLEERVAVLEKKLAALEQRCTCGQATIASTPSSSAAVQSTEVTEVGPDYAVVCTTFVNGTKSCKKVAKAAALLTANGYTVSGGAPATVSYGVSACANGQCGTTSYSMPVQGGFYMSGDGSCASGNCSSGGCANGQCGGSSARRGFFGFGRRR